MERQLPYGRFGENHGLGSGFKKMLAVSILLHLIALFVLVFYSNSTQKRIFYTPIYMVDLIEPSRVKRKAPKSPAKTHVAKEKRKDLKPPAGLKSSAVKKTTNKPGKAGKPLSVTKQDVATVKSAVAKLKEQVEGKRNEEFLEGRIAALKKEMLEESKRKRRLEELISEIETMEATVSKGVRLETSMPAPLQGGIRRDQFELEFKSYYLTLQRHIGNVWIYTGPMVEGDFVIVSIKVDHTGKILERWIEESSGKEVLDSSALKAIDKVSKRGDLPPRPEGLGNGPVEIGFRFCPAGCKG